MRRLHPIVLFLLLSLTAHAQNWPANGGDAAGRRYSAATEITPENVGRLTPAWTFHTGEAPRSGSPGSAFEDTPILAGGKLLVCTPSDRVIALDPASGHAQWVFDPKLPAELRPGNGFVCRGVAVWDDTAAPPGAVCAARVVLATLDARVIELDLANGQPCEQFGTHGEIRLTFNIPELYPGEVTLDSPPAIMGDTIIFGSAIDDMSRAHTPSSAVRALDARTGQLRWQFHPVPDAAGQPGAGSWQDTSFLRSGSANVWAPMSVDAARDLVFLPTAGLSASFYGGERKGDDLFDSSVVALRGSTGQMAWHFQTTHHDIWDYDVAAQPTLAVLHRDGGDRPVVIVATKTGFVFVLDRETGQPVLPVTEQKVPESDVPGEHAAPTQPVPLTPEPLLPQRLTPQDAWGVALFDRILCGRRIAALRSEGLYTPPSLRGTIIYPFTGGGVNWGGGAFDPKSGLFVVNVSNLAHVVRLIPRADYAAARASTKAEIGRGLGTPYAAERTLLTSIFGIPCNRPPWGMLAAIDLNTGAIRWKVPLGSWVWGRLRGLPNEGGPIVTARGVVFIAAAMDDKLHAFDLATGALLWQADLPAGGQATPMTYVAGDRQFVVVAAGGHARMGTKLGDAVVAFALPR